MARIYADLDVVGLSSLNEGSPVALIEALASARPVVSTHVGGIPEVVVHGETGLTVRSSDSSAFADAVVTLLGDRPLGERLGQAGRRHVYPRYDSSRLVDDVKQAMAGLLEPTLKENVIGAAEVRKVFDLSKGGKVAGCVVSHGRLVRGKVRVMRRKNLIYEGIIQVLRRFQDEVNEVRAGMECGIRIDGFDDFQIGDSIEAYTLEKVAPKL